MLREYDIHLHPTIDVSIYGHYPLVNGVSIAMGYPNSWMVYRENRKIAWMMTRGNPNCGTIYGAIGILKQSKCST